MQRIEENFFKEGGEQSQGDKRRFGFCEIRSGYTNGIFRELESKQVKNTIDKDLERLES